MVAQVDDISAAKKMTVDIRLHAKFSRPARHYRATSQNRRQNPDKVLAVGDKFYRYMELQMALKNKTPMILWQLLQCI